MEKRTIVVIAVIVVVVIILAAVAAAVILLTRDGGDDRGPEYDWGDEGTLELTIETDAVAMTPDGHIGVNITLSNTGATDVRLYFTFGPNIDIKNKDGSYVEYWGDMYSPPAYIKDDELEVLKAGQSRKFTEVIDTGSWELEANNTYVVYALYSCREYKGITLPIWTGELRSNEITFEVKDQ